MNITTKTAVVGFLAGVVTATAIPMLMDSISAAMAATDMGECRLQPMTRSAGSTSGDDMYTVGYQQPACSYEQGFRITRIYQYSETVIGVVFSR